MKARYKEGGSFTVVIDDTEVNSWVFDNEIVDWVLAKKDELVLDLITWIAEEDSGTDVQRMMVSDLLLIMNKQDDVFWSANSTNKYVFRSEDPEQFDEICKEVLEASKKLEE